MIRYIRLACLLLVTTIVAACAVGLDENATTFEKVEASYTTAKSQIDVYAALPECTAEVKTLCSKPATVAKLNEYLGLVGTQIELAKSQIAAGEDSTMAERRALTTLGTLFAIYAAQALSKQ